MKMSDINKARSAFEQELKKILEAAGVPDAPVNGLTERFIDFVYAIREELRKTDGR